MRQLIRPAVLLSVLVATSHRAAMQPLPSSAPIWAGRVDAVFAEFTQPDAPGCALGVYRGGEVLYARGYGLADVERRVPITRDTVFDLGSTSKQITATAVLLLAQDGRLSLDDDVRRYVPELPSYGATITLRHLLQHTSGLRDYIGLLNLAGYSTDDVTGDADALATLVRQRALNFAPGTDQLYSNSGYFLASVVVERVSGEPLRTFVQRRIFAPLGMTRSHVLHRVSDLVPHRAQAYSRRDDGTLGLDLSRWEQTGDGAVWTTIDDLARWDANFATGMVGGATLRAQLEAPGRLDDGRPLPWAYGLGVRPEQYRGQPVVRHAGSWSGFRAELLRFPTLRTSVAVLCNVAHAVPTTLAERVADVVLAADLSAPTATPASSSASSRRAADGTHTPSPAQIARVAGRYISDELDTTWTIEGQDGRLWCRRRAQRAALVMQDADTFVMGPVTLRFSAPTADVAAGFTLDMGRVKGVTFRRVP